MAGLAGRRDRQSGDQPRRGAGTVAPQEAAGAIAQGPEPAGAAHPDGAAAERGTDDAGRSVQGVQHQQGARAPDRGAGLREAAEGDPQFGDRTAVVDSLTPAESRAIEKGAVAAPLFLYWMTTQISSPGRLLRRMASL